MFADDPEGKPISVIITTLAAAAYLGEQDVASALDTILTNMGSYVRNTRPRVPNPVNPVEDFADKWYDAKYEHLNLERKFWLWLEQAQQETPQPLYSGRAGRSCGSTAFGPAVRRLRSACRPDSEGRGQSGASNGQGRHAAESELEASHIRGPDGLRPGFRQRAASRRR